MLSHFCVVFERKNSMEKFRYNNPERRINKLNRFLMRAAFIVFGVLIFYQVMLLESNEHMKSMVWNIPVLVVMGVVNLIVYKMRPTVQYYRVIIIVEVAWQFMFYMLTTDATCSSCWEIFGKLM